MAVEANTAVQPVSWQKMVFYGAHSSEGKPHDQRSFKSLCEAVKLSES